MKKNKKLKIGFSIATYKRNEDLKRLIASINCSKSLSNKNIDVSIIVRDNDKNSKLTKKVLEKFAPDTSLIYSKNKQNEGGRLNVWKNLVKASNYVDYVILCSDDDYLLPDFIPQVTEHLLRYKTDYLVTNFYTQFPNLNSSYKQYGLEKPFLQKFMKNKKVDLIISNRILTGTCFSSNVIKKMVSLTPNNYYLTQNYIQYLACFSSSCARIDSKLAIHQVGNIIHWDEYDPFEDMVLNKIKGYINAYRYQNGNKKELDKLLLKSLINFPIWFGTRLIFSKLAFSWRLRINYIIFKPFHLKIIRDLKGLLSTFKN